MMLVRVCVHAQLSKQAKKTKTDFNSRIKNAQIKCIKCRETCTRHARTHTHMHQNKKRNRCLANKDNNNIAPIHRMKKQTNQTVARDRQRHTVNGGTLQIHAKKTHCTRAKESKYGPKKEEEMKKTDVYA